MIDLHCHILPTIDDGAADISETVAMAEIAATDGIHTIVATPHIDNQLPETMARIDEAVHQANTALSARSIPVTIIAGAENNSLHLGDSSGITISNSSYVLIEFPMGYLPISSADILSSLTGQGLRPIIAHPERNFDILHKPNLLLDLLNKDIAVQLTAGSLMGEFGPSVRECAFYLLQNNLVDFIASDAHSAVRRLPQLSFAVKKAARLVGKDKATGMVTDNPQRVLNNQPLKR